MLMHDPQQLDSWRGCTLVPTMGALHAGHASLIRYGASLGNPVIVSVFVNPTQFGPGEDFEAYPRTLKQDVEIAIDAGATAIFAPSVETMYPPDGRAEEAPALPEVAILPRLEDAHRPDHFAGVVEVVARFFDLTMPAAAVFGEKDYQQLRVLEQMVDALGTTRWPELVIHRAATVREADGLAMSSRNRYLDADERQRALALSRGLEAADGAASIEDAEQVMLETLVEAGLVVDYACVRDSQSLMPLERGFSGDARGLIAARLGTTRLIDNRSLTIGVPSNGG